MPYTFPPIAPSTTPSNHADADLDWQRGGGEPPPAGSFSPAQGRAGTGVWPRQTKATAAIVRLSSCGGQKIEGFAAFTVLTFILESKSFTLAPDPLMMDLEQSQPEMKEFPGIALNGQIGQPQPVDWPKILQLCQAFNRNLPNPIVLPFVRVARDETRTNSLYYRLRGVEYP